jgi:hypothetical protein
MGAGLDRSPGAVECCGRLLRLLAFVFFLVCACLLMAMVATDGASSVGSSNAATSAAAMTTGSSPVWRSGGRGRTAGADAFRSSERRIPKGPDPIHNRYVDECICIHDPCTFAS